MNTQRVVKNFNCIHRLLAIACFIDIKCGIENIEPILLCLEAY